VLIKLTMTTIGTKFRIVDADENKVLFYTDKPCFTLGFMKMRDMRGGCLRVDALPKSEDHWYTIAAGYVQHSGNAWRPHEDFERKKDTWVRDFNDYCQVSSSRIAQKDPPSACKCMAERLYTPVTKCTARDSDSALLVMDGLLSPVTPVCPAVLSACGGR
jgi:hypothetical protein